MAKVVAVIAAIAVNIFPGIGQFISAQLVAIGVGVQTAASIASFITLTVTSVGIQAGLSLLGLGPSAPKPDTTVTNIKTPRPPRVSGYGISRLYGAYILFETAETGQAVNVLAVHDGQMDGLIGFYLNDDAVTLTGNTVNEGDDGRYDNNIKLYYTTGVTPGTPFAAITGLLPGIWTAAHRGDGVVLLAMTCEPSKSDKFLEVYPNGVPEASMVARWQKCPDPYAVDPSNPASWTWTENPIRQLLHYKLVREGVDYATKIAPTIAYWRTASDVCNEPITLKAGGTEARYRSWVTHKHTDLNRDVTGALLATCDGWIAPREDGALIVYAGKYTAPTVTIGPDKITSYTWDGVGVDDDKAVNELLCSYISVAHDYNTVETDPWTDEPDITARGQVLSASLDPQVPSWGQVRRLAKRKVDRSNQPRRGTVTTNVAGRIARGHRYIWLTLVEAGATFYDGPVEITSLTRNLQTGGVTFGWIAANPAIDNWNPVTEEGNPATVGDRVAAAPLTAPTIDSASALPATDVSSSRVTLQVTGPNRTDLQWYVRWRVTGEPTWSGNIAFPDTDPGPLVILNTENVPLNSSIELQVAYEIGDGRISPWSLTSTVSTSTANLAPGPVTNTSVSGGVGQAVVNWRNPSSDNYNATRVYRNTTNTFGTATLVTTRMGGIGALDTYTNTGLAAGTYYFWLVTVSTGGTAGSPVSVGSATVT